jgi:hypothetical protein
VEIASGKAETKRKEGEKKRESETRGALETS